MSAWKKLVARRKACHESFLCFSRSRGYNRRTIPELCRRPVWVGGEGLAKRASGFKAGSNLPEEGQRVNDLKRFPDAELIDGYVDEAAWFWFDASTHEKSLEAGLHRIAAHCILNEIRQRGLEEPSSELAYARARMLF